MTDHAVYTRVGIWLSLFLGALLLSDPDAWSSGSFFVMYLETFSFPLGLMHFLWFITKSEESKAEIAIWILYAIHLSLFLTIRNKWFFRILLGSLIAVLALNVTGCREILAEAPVDMDR